MIHRDKVPERPLTPPENRPRDPVEQERSAPDTTHCAVCGETMPAADAPTCSPSCQQKLARPRTLSPHEEERRRQKRFTRRDGVETDR